jgi:hypothetical protein
MPCPMSAIGQASFDPFYSSMKVLYQHKIAVVAVQLYI